MTEQFKGKTIFITGAGLGIGFGLSEAFAEVGAKVALNDIEPDLAESAAQKINEAVSAERVYPYSFDVADVEALGAAMQDFAAKQGRLDIAIANAGLTNYGSFLDYTPEAFDRLTSVNLRGSYFTAQAAAKIMIDKQIKGRILLLSSVTGVQAVLNLGAYGITKAGIRMMARSLGLELGEYGITVNAIAPGAIMTERTLQDDPNFAENWGTVTPSRRVGYVQDIINTAMFLTSTAASHISGQTIVVDGGWTNHSPLPEEHPELPEHSSQLR